MATFPNGEEVKHLHNFRFITGIQYTKSLLKALNNITFIYDPNWEVGNSDIPTFPVCFYHIKGIHEVMEAEISQKTALFYNDNSPLATSGLKGAMTNVVADNIVIKPKQYKLDILIPFEDLSLLTDNYILSSINGVTTTLTTGASNSDTWFNKLQGYTNCVTPVYEILKSLIMTIATTNYGSVEDIITTITSTPDYNKNSLEAMWRNRGILKMKMWNNWKYKYVAITSLDISKEPTEDGVYEASMIVQEVPIMTFRKTGTPTIGYVNPILKVTGNVVKGLLDEKGV